MPGVVLKKHQKELYRDILNGLKAFKKVLLYALCGCGKTVIALSVIDKYVKEGKRVLISAYARSEIRTQWCTEIKDKFGHLIKDLQVVCALPDIPFYENLGIDAVTSDNVSPDKKIIISIPQTIKTSDLGKIDLFVIDEAHEYLDIKEGVLMDVIDRNSKKTSKIIGLSGTAFDLMKEGSFFHKAHYVIYDLIQALEDKVILSCNVIGELFKFSLPNNCYDKEDELNEQGRTIWKNNFGMLNDKGKYLLKQKSYLAAKLERIIKELKGKTLIFVPRGTKNETFKNEQVVADFINLIMENKHAAVVKTSTMYENAAINKEQVIKNEEKFRSPNSETNFMVVVGMCGTGWDFPGLNNVIDLTFSRNPKVLIQRQSRAIRLDPENGKTGPVYYYYCIDQSMSVRKATYVISNALSLMTKRRIMNNDGTVSDYFFQEGRLRILGSGVDRQIISISTSDLQYCEGVHRKQFYYRTYQELCQEKNFYTNFLRPIMDYGLVNKAVISVVREYVKETQKRGIEKEDIIHKIIVAIEKIPHVVESVFGVTDLDDVLSSISFDKTNRCFFQ